MDEKLELIISYFNKVKTRCTYGVVAEIIGTNSQSVGKHLGERRPEASWVVNASTGDPTGYSDSEKHPVPLATTAPMSQTNSPKLYLAW